MGPHDISPLFERKEDKFFIREDSSVGTPITKVKTVTNSTVTYRIISGDEDNPFFTIDFHGQVTLARTLDRELKDNHLIGVLAETDSSPPLTALAEISLQVLDENDHAPRFESNPYSINLAENIEEGTSILKVIAHDKDLGSNGEVRYSFGSDIGDLANVFTVDAYTGWISTLVQLDKEKQPEYKFQVIICKCNVKYFVDLLKRDLEICRFVGDPFFKQCVITYDDLLFRWLPLIMEIRSISRERRCTSN